MSIIKLQVKSQKFQKAHQEIALKLKQKHWRDVYHIYIVVVCYVQILKYIYQEQDIYFSKSYSKTHSLVEKVWKKPRL